MLLHELLVCICASMVSCQHESTVSPAALLQCVYASCWKLCPLYICRERQQEKKQQTAEEQQMQRRGWYWLAAAGAAVTAFVLLSGQYVTFDIYPMDMELDDEEDDE